MAESAVKTPEGEGVNLWVAEPQASSTGPPKFLEVNADGVPVHGQVPESVARATAAGPLPLAGIVLLNAGAPTTFTIPSVQAVRNRGARVIKVVNVSASAQTLDASGASATFIHGSVSAATLVLQAGASATLTATAADDICVLGATGDVSIGATVISYSDIVTSLPAAISSAVVPRGTVMAQFLAELNAATMNPLASASATVYMDFGPVLIAYPGRDTGIVLASNVGGSGVHGVRNDTGASVWMAADVSVNLDNGTTITSWDLQRTTRNGTTGAGTASGPLVARVGGNAIISNNNMDRNGFREFVLVPNGQMLSYGFRYFNANPGVDNFTANLSMIQVYTLYGI